MDFLALSSECAAFVPPYTLEAIVKTESNFDPLRIGVNGGSRLERQPVNIEEAIVTAQWLLDNGYNIDLGLGQVNSSNLNRVGLTVHDAFDPCKNLKAAGIIFQKSYQAAIRQYPEEQAVKVALSAYNTGNFVRGFHNGYVQKVLDNMPDKAQSPPPATASLAVRPIPLADSHKPAPPHPVEPKPTTTPILQASLTGENQPKPLTAFVYQNGGNAMDTHSKTAEATAAEPSVNVYSSNATNAMVYR